MLYFLGSLPLEPQGLRVIKLIQVDKLLNEIDEAKQLIEEAKDSFELRRAAILDKAFRGEYGLKKDPLEYNRVMLGDSLISIPSEWKIMNIEALCNLISDCPHSTPKYFEDGEYPAIRTSDVKFGKVNISNARRVSKQDYVNRTKRIIPQKEDIIYCREGTVGNAGIVSEEKICLAQRVVLFRPNKNEVFSNISQTTSPRINISTLKKLVLPIPPLKTQQQIIDIIEKSLGIEQEAFNFYSLESEIEGLKQSILSKAFRGDLGTNDPTEKSASELLKEVLQEKVK